MPSWPAPNYLEIQFQLPISRFFDQQSNVHQVLWPCFMLHIGEASNDRGYISTLDRSLHSRRGMQRSRQQGPLCDTFSSYRKIHNDFRVDSRKTLKRSVCCRGYLRLCMFNAHFLHACHLLLFLQYSLYKVNL